MFLSIEEIIFNHNYSSNKDYTPSIMEIFLKRLSIKKEEMGGLEGGLELLYSQNHSQSLKDKDIPQFVSTTSGIGDLGKK
jgi:hypothetical protein